MKKRIIKKWINRYITPLVKELPRIDYRPEGCTSVKVINGEVIPEGNSFLKEYHHRIAISKQMMGIRQVLALNKGRGIYLRMAPEPIIRSNQIEWMDPEYWRKNPKMKFYGIATRFLIEE